jgi:hypothetical protein
MQCARPIVLSLRKISEKSAHPIKRLLSGIRLSHGCRICILYYHTVDAVGEVNVAEMRNVMHVSGSIGGIDLIT